MSLNLGTARFHCEHPRVYDFDAPYEHRYDCLDEPRLAFVDRFSSRCVATGKRTATRTWYIDGVQVGSPAEALAALEHPCPSSK